MFVKQKNVWLRNYKVMNRLQAHHFFFSTSKWEILREHMTSSRVADQNTAGLRLNLVRSWVTPHENLKKRREIGVT